MEWVVAAVSCVTVGAVALIVVIGVWYVRSIVRAFRPVEAEPAVVEVEAPWSGPLSILPSPATDTMPLPVVLLPQCPRCARGMTTVTGSSWWCRVCAPVTGVTRVFA